MTKIKTYFVLAIVPVLWLGMMTSLVWRTAGQDKGISYLSNGTGVFDPEIGTRWYEISCDGSQVGYMRHTLRELDEQGSGFSFYEESAILAEIGGTEAMVVLKLGSTLDKAMLPLELEGELAIGQWRLFLEGERSGDHMQVTISGLGQEYTSMIDFDHEMVTPSSVYPLLAAQDMEQGDRFVYSSINPLTQGASSMEIEYLGDSELEVEKLLRPVRLFEVKTSGLTSKVYIDQKGTLIREEASNYLSELADFDTVRALYREINPREQ